MLQKFRQALRLLKINLTSVIWFQIIYALLALLIFLPLYLGFSEAAKLATGFTYISNDNIKTFLTNPWVLAMIAVFVLLASFFLVVQGSSLITLFELSYRGEKISAPRLLFLGLKKAREIIKPKNFPIITYILLFIPVLFAVMLFGLVTFIRMPEYIQAFVFERPSLLWIIIGIATVCLIAIAGLIFAPLCFTLEHKSFFPAVKKGLKLIRRGFLRTLLYLILWNLLLLTIGLALYLVLIFLSAIFVLAFRGPDFVLAAIVTVVSIFNVISAILWMTLLIPHNVALLTILYCEKENVSPGETAWEFSSKLDKRGRRFSIASRAFAISAIPIALLFSFFFLSDFARRYPQNNIFLQNPAMITAHRANSGFAPENTLAGVKSAVHYLADAVEIDVQQTSDGVVVLNHDKTLKRTTGYDKPVPQCTYAEIQQLDAGIRFGPEFAGEPVPTLDEILGYAQFRIQVVIELKYEDESPSLLPAVVNLINKYRMQDDCYVASFARKTLAQIKRLDPEIQTCYLSAFSIGDVENFAEADVISLEASAASKSIVARIKNLGKQVHIWTVNSEESLRQVAKLHPDSVITDDPVLARKLIYAEKLNFWSTLFLEIFR